MTGMTKDLKTRTKDFGATKKLDEFEPLEFTLNGQSFSCRPAIQGRTLLEFVADADSDKGGKAAEALYGFFKKTMHEESYTRFDAMLGDPEIIVDLSLLGDIASWLVEEYTARPTPEPTS